MNNWFKRNGTHIAVVALFLAICFLYLTPAFQGKTLGQSDVIGAQSTQKEVMDYRAKDTTILWTNQIFSGMPTFQIWAPYPSNIASHVVSAIKATFPNPVDTVLILLLGTYFLFIVLKLNPWLAAAGAIAFTFSTYNIILLVAGHSNQAFAIAFFAPLLASIIMTLRGQYYLGGALTAFFLAMEIRANHVQMTYYLMFAIVILIAIELYHAVKAKATAGFVRSIGFLAVATLLALSVNASLLWSTYDYGTETIRGKSNLIKNTKEPNNGLDRDYAYQYSQGVAESFTFLVPNAAGGGSGLDNIDENSEFVKVFASKGIPQEQIGNAISQISRFPGYSMYWGPKRPSTFGPYYFGAAICFLFILGLLVVRSRLKWWLLGTVILTMLLSFGGNFPFLSDLFFNYFPLYNKFRAVESVLAVTGLCFPLLALLAIKEFIDNPDKADLFKKLKIAGYITGVLLIVLIAMPELLLSFKPFDQVEAIKTLAQALNNDTATASAAANALVRDRTALERNDAIRSLIFVVIAFGLLWAFVKQKINVTIMSVSFLALMLVDMWQVDKRYLKETNFQDKVETAQAIQPREVDNFIMKDKDPDFRVFDASDVNGIKQDTYNPFFHKSIGGYSAARLKRYEELLDNQFSKSINEDVLDMLNAKYIITTDPKTGQASMRANSTACGHAWFVKSVKYVENADEEMQAISSFSPKDEAMIDKSYKPVVEAKAVGVDPNGTIKLLSYNPDHLVYQSSSSANQVAVFSEIYYKKGWKMTIDGVEQPYYRADYLLRAATIPLGNHTIKFDFHPASYYTGEGISMAGSILLVLALGGAAFMETKKKKVE
ncbi:YfhO family protein [Mucilaginibacter glaciei]|uniref:YfhO family protein n=1 Tax=Mucilaginibacter glaciei TaxID=2772109 RepID=A0A926NT10_9SPHI|nr:YfhO family protein [Mucilaginibacter glaciei]MBD1394072.1 YfhO family protein [Mucilaginibacter glaciei]